MLPSSGRWMYLYAVSTDVGLNAVLARFGLVQTMTSAEPSYLRRLHDLACNKIGY